MTMAPPSFLFRGSWPKVSRNTAVLRREIVGGAQASNSTTMPMALRMCTTGAVLSAGQMAALIPWIARNKQPVVL